MSILKLEGVSKSYGDACILEDIFFEVEAGQSMAFVSPSGSGKSTLLSMMGLLLKPTEGRIIVDGVDTSRLDDKELSRLRQKTFGFIFQHTQLVGSLRAIENVMAPASFAKGLNFDARDRAQGLLEQFGMESRIEHYPFQLSIGQKRRVAAARAMLMNPRILIADEPTNDLDAKSALTVANALFEHVRTGGVLLFATHDMELAARADIVLELKGKTFCPQA